ncbi:NAD(P)/FAD-dependent oxidoreductase [Pseudonocardia abyssalis]|uniref:FAD-binding oxidoreductase n=1 Tax=Pseudonocardia abyssalis TaxID=2792008 RepID=A0ABS6USK6_9PSEU|nr:FAD-binding oxidoreductase [Pseudonocardia abyssalis]MBW0119457.1 FAD-binding oxidoreductase [Pseudonocardia abyssalis]MBW0135234.1 FAD-binding oxidoreductase [Pseudonocardia abyssalis]
MVDVVVVGGGIAGASVAYELAADRSVLLLEAETALATHSTARSAAIYVPGHGVGAVRALIERSGPRFAALADELGTPPLLTPRPVLWVGCDDEGEAALVDVLAERAGEPGAPVAIDAGDARRLCPALAPGAVRAAALTEGSGDIDTDALHQGYVRGLRARGGTVRTAAPVTAMTRDGSGWRVEAGGDVLRAGAVVNAAGAWADEVAALAGVPRTGLTPLRRTIAMVRVPDPSRLGRPMVIDAAERFYFKSEGEDLLVSRADETPSPPGDARPDDVDVALALERVEAVTGLGLRSVRTSWAGLRSFVPDRCPVVGAWPEHPGFWFVAGQGGSGIESAPALSVLAASVVRGAPAPVDLAPSRLHVS